MKKKMRVMTENPLNAETPIESLRTWTTDNAVFFKRNQGQMMQRPIKLSSWKLSIEGLVKHRLTLTFENIRRAHAESGSGQHPGMLRQQSLFARRESFRQSLDDRRRGQCDLGRHLA
jgi:hypothetical protein